MSRMGQAVFEGEEFAQNNFGLTEAEFREAAHNQFGTYSVQYEAAIAEFLEYEKLCDQVNELIYNKGNV